MALFIASELDRLLLRKLRLLASWMDGVTPRGCGQFFLLGVLFNQLFEDVCMNLLCDEDLT